MRRKSKESYDAELQKQKDEEILNKELSEWMIHYEEKENSQRIRLHIVSGKSWKIMSDMGIEISGHHAKSHTDVYTLTTEQLIDFIHLFYEVNTKTIKPAYIPKARKPRSDKGAKRKIYNMSAEDKINRTKRINKVNEKRTTK